MQASRREESTLLATPECHVCGASRLEASHSYPGLLRIASDSTVWRRNGTLATCPHCGAVQKFITPAWQAECDEIYSRYEIYRTSGGVEQPVFIAESGVGQTRSLKLVDYVRNSGALIPQSGCLLDVGCGNGAFLRAFGSRFSAWALFGTEVSDKYRADVEAIAGVKGFFTADIDGVPDTYDLVSLVHVLEHIPHPVPYLRRLRRRINPSGHLFIEVPYFEDNPFDLLIADHATHYTPELLSVIMRAAGFEVVAISHDWVSKEISLVASVKGEETPIPPQNAAMQMASKVENSIAWLKGVLLLAVRAEEPFGVFGTSNAAAWLRGEVGAKISFFVDEDESKRGKYLDGKPIFTPAQVPEGASVIFPLPFRIATAAATRLEKEGYRGKFLLPPSFQR